MLQIITSNRFEKDLKTAIKRGKDIQKLKEVIDILCIPAVLPVQNRDHSLTGEYRAFRECHIEPDWLLIYRVDGDILVLTPERTATSLGNERRR